MDLIVLLNNITGINLNLLSLFHRLNEAIVMKENSWNLKATLTKKENVFNAADKVKVSECVINAETAFCSHYLSLSTIPEQCADLTVSQMEKKTQP